MLDKNLIKNKMSDIQGYFGELKPIVDLDIKDILQDNMKVHTTERLFQLIVDTSIDINTHIISESNFQTPEDYQSTFITLAENKILSMDLAIKIAPSVGLRNLVVHKYGKVDMKKMMESIKNEMGDYVAYLKEINKLAR